MTHRATAPVTHDLKTWPQFFDATWTGHKPFEIRRNDRDFQIGDLLCLKEWDPKGSHYTGRRISAVVRDLWRGLPGVKPNHVAMLLEPFMRADNLFD